MRTFVFKVTRLSFAVPLIILINFFVYMKWAMSNNTELLYMADNYLVSWDALLQGRYWVLLTSVFSHSHFLHFFLNMFVLSSFGKIIEQAIGFKSFVKFYLLAGIIGSLSHAFFSAYLMKDPSQQALGASGAVAGVILLFSLLHPKQKILILGFIPAPAITGALIFMGLDIWGLLAQVGGHGLPIGHGAHLGGAFTGVIYYFFILKPKLQNPTRKTNVYSDPNVIDADYEKIE